MGQRKPIAQRFFTRLIIILIASAGFLGCSTPPPVQISDREQPPSRRIQSVSVSQPPQQVPLPASGQHQVARGETLYSIAWRYGLDYRELARRNNIAPPYTIFPSQSLRLDTPEKSGHARGASPAAPPRLSSTTIAGRSEKATPAPAAPPRSPVSTGSLQWQWPAPGRILVPFNGNNGLNKGIDIEGNLGQPVIAAAPGQVVYAGSGLRGYGKLLIIKHNDTYLSAYAHNQRLLVQEGDLVKAGQRVADMGSSGTDSVKLHFEIRRDGTPVDPVRYLPKR